MSNKTQILESEVLQKLRQVGTSKSGRPREATDWRLYKTAEHGFAVKDMNHFEWRSVLLKDGERELHNKREAMAFLTMNGIPFHEYKDDLPY